MASDVERNRCGANNNINLSPLPHGFPSGTSTITDGEVLIESEFLELDNQLHYSKTVHILLTDEFVFVKEMRDRRDSEAYVLQYESGKTVSKFRRSDVVIKVCDGCAFTFKAKWSKETSVWKTYELCGKDEVWPKWLRSFNVQETQGLQMIPSDAICEIGDDSDSDDYSEDDDSEDIQIPEYTLTLAVDRTISTWSVSLLNPSKVRRLAISQHHHAALPSLASSYGSDLEDIFDSFNAGSLCRSNSHPRLSLVKPFRCPSLPNVGELENVRVDADLKPVSCRTRGHSTGEDPKLRLNASTLFSREGESIDQNTALATLQQRVEDLRSHPTNLNFVRGGKRDEATWESMTTPKHRRKHSLQQAMGNEANRIPMPSDKRSPVLNNKKDLFDENKKSSGKHEIKTRDRSLSPKKSLAGNSDSLPVSKRPDFAAVVQSVLEKENKTSTARQLDFKDDMAVTLEDGDQPPRKEKIKRFWSVLYKKRPKLRMHGAESDDSLKENQTSIRNTQSSSSRVTDSDSHIGPGGGTRRGGLSGNFTTPNHKVSYLASAKEEGITTQTQNKQGG